MRSLLFVPADDERKLARALDSGADALILDLEDAVAAPAKGGARRIVGAFLASLAERRNRPRMLVRVNALQTGLTEADLEAVLPVCPDGLMLPKCRGSADVRALVALMDDLGRPAAPGTAASGPGILPIATETAASLFGIGSYSEAGLPLIGLTWGAEDLAAELGAETNRASDGSYATPFQLARSLTLFGAASAGIEPIDAVYTSFRDLEGLRTEAEAGRRDGFTGKLAIHPGQVEVINATFTPSEAALARARTIVDLFASAAGHGVIGFEGQMLDRPHLIRAQRLLARAGSQSGPGGEPPAVLGASGV